MAPTGGLGKRVGNNPLAVAVPGAGNYAVAVRHDGRANLMRGEDPAVDQVVDAEVGERIPR